jgi:predicted metal-dependent phosphoesterase TrpH|tara:strand:+ start:640 stop:1512 length:873 start_codon:yes stop_codon:yes gene_type:complete
MIRAGLFLLQGGSPLSFTVDLHLHTTASDGTRTPKELVKLLSQNGLKLVAITDHDSLEGIPEAKRELAYHPDMTLIPGVEISADMDESEVHVLGYHLNEDDAELQKVLAHFRKGREGRGEQMVQKLNEMGIAITWERVVDLAQGGAIARPHVARAMLEKGYITELKEAFDKYIGRGGPAYVRREKMSPEESVELIRKFGGIPVLAHPTYTKDPESLVASLVTKGLAGMEVYYKNYNEETVQSLLAISQRHGLLALGGSDYHANYEGDEVEPGLVGPPVENGQRLLEMGPR